MSSEVDDEDEALRTVALRNASSILAARKRSEEELVRAREELRETADRLHAIFNQAASGMAVAALDGRFEQVNQRLADILGRAPEELLGVHFVDITHPDDREASAANVRGVLEGRLSHYSQEKRYLRKDGQTVWANTTVTALRDAEGRPRHFIGVVDDISDRKRAELALRDAHQRLQLALSAGHLGDWSWDAANDLVTLGERAAEIFGLPPNETITWAAMRELLHADDRERARIAVERALEDRADYNIEYRVLVAGSERWIAAKGRGSYAVDGSIVGMTGVVQDVTERRRMEEALRDETRVLELINRTGTKLASKLELQEVVQAVTDAATELSGAEFGAFFYNTAGAGGDAFLLYTLSGAPREAFASFDPPRATPLFAPTFRGEAVIRCDDVLDDPRYGRSAPHFGMPKGHLPVRSYLAVPVLSRSGTVIGGLFFGHSKPGVFTQRSERLVEGVAAQAAVAIDNARLYEERGALVDAERAARTQAERASQLKDDFLATLSHELRTPLNAILGWSQILRQQLTSKSDVERGLQTIERNARLQAQLIEDLLDISRITSGKVRLDIQPVEMASVIEAAIEVVRPAADAKGIRIEKVLDTGVTPISGDTNRLQQVIWNLLSNAIKFTPKGGKVQVVLERVNSHIEISVADSGAGITPEFLPQVFERFHQADGSTTRRHGGLGLGLSIVKHLVELHGGTVRAHSAGLGEGATFTVHLPLSVVRQSSSEDRRHPAALSSALSDYTLADLRGVRVLVVDDEADARELIRRVLVDCRADVVTAASAEEALAVIASSELDVLVSDIGMPDVDGYELLRRVRSRQGSGSRMPAIALTAFARSEDRTRALRAGFLVHVAKPVEPAELAATVASVVGRAAV